MSGIADLSELVGIEQIRLPVCMVDYWSDGHGGPLEIDESRKLIISFACLFRDHLIGKSQAKTALIDWSQRMTTCPAPELVESEVDRAYASDVRLSCHMLRDTDLGKYCEDKLCDYPRDGPKARAWHDNNKIRVEDVVEFSQRKDGSRSVKFSPDKAAAVIIKEYPIVSTPDELIWIYRDGIYVPDGEVTVDQILDRIVGDLYNSRSASETHRKIVLRTLKDYNIFDSNPYLFAVDNGVVDMSTGKFKKHDPKFYLTQKSPVKFDKKATCPEIEKFLGSALATVDNVLSFLDIMTAKTTDLLFEYFVVMIGGGANGKSKAEELIRAFFGDESIAEVDIATLTQNRFDRKEIFKKKFLINSEVSGDEKESRWIKYISGGGRLDADQKGREHIQFRPRCIIIIDTNDPPRFADASYGFQRRLVKIDFPNTFVDEPKAENGNERQKDPFVVEKITSPKELSGLLNLLIMRAPDVLPECKIHRRADGKVLAFEYEMQANSIAEFFEQFCELDSSNWIAKTSLYEYYKAFCKKINAVPKSQTIFNRYAKKTFKLEEARKFIEGSFSRIYYGIGLDDIAFNEFLNQGDTDFLPEKTLSVPGLPTLPTLNEVVGRIVNGDMGGIEHGEKSGKPGKLGTDIENPGKKSVLNLVYILREIPKFVGIDELNYGPFRPDDVANIPEVHAKNFVEKGFARTIGGNTC